MGPRRIAGIALIALGLFLAWTGYEMSGSVTNQLNEAFNGSPSDNVMLRYIAGAACVVAGGLIAK